MNVRELLHYSLHRLPDLSRLDGEILLCSVMNQPRHFLYAHGDVTVSEDIIADYNSMISKRAAGFPLAYLIGHKEFWSLTLEVTRDTLIPRPETELLVELTLKMIPAEGRYSLLDMGTGSGAIAIALATERPNCLMTATDISAAALDVARHNARRLKLENIRFIESDWFAKLPAQHFDLILSNPPYVESGYPGLVGGEIRHEPRIALDGGTHGLNPYQRIIPAARSWLRSGGCIMFEHGNRQADAICELLDMNHYQNITTVQDAAGLDRVTLAELP